MELRTLAASGYHLLNCSPGRLGLTLSDERKRKRIIERDFIRSYRNHFFEQHRGAGEVIGCEVAQPEELLDGEVGWTGLQLRFKRLNSLLVRFCLKTRQAQIVIHVFVLRMPFRGKRKLLSRPSKVLPFCPQYADFVVRRRDYLFVVGGFTLQSLGGPG